MVNMNFRPAVLLVISFIGLGLTAASSKTNAAKEVLQILNNPDLYDKAIFPNEASNESIIVDVNMYLRGLEVDDINMRMSLDLTFRMMWRDHRLKYSEAGVESVRFSDYTKFWIPDPFFKGSLETVQLETVHTEAYISVKNRGNITFSTRFNIVSKCILDLRRFPHDRQDCPIEIASYGFTKDDIQFRFHSYNPLEFTKSISTSNYILEAAKTDNCDSKTSTGDYSCLSIILTLKRNFSTYLFKWYFPCMCFVTTALFSEFIGVDALLPRLVLTIGPLLALTASSISYSSSLASVPYSTALDVFTGISLATIFITCFHVIIGYYYANKEQTPKEEISDEESGSKFQKLKSKLAEKGDYWARIAIISFYWSFVFVYFLAYSV